MAAAMVEGMIAKGTFAPGKIICMGGTGTSGCRVTITGFGL